MSTEKRAFSIELHTKCFTQAMHVALHAAGQRRAQLADVVRVLAVGLLRAAPRRVAQHVHAHGAGEVGADRPQLPTDRVADPLLESGPTSRRGPCYTGKQVAWPTTTAPRSVAEREAGDADPLDLGRGANGLLVAVRVPRNVRPAQVGASPSRHHSFSSSVVCPTISAAVTPVAPGRHAAVSSAASWLDVPIAIEHVAGLLMPWRRPGS